MKFKELKNKPVNELHKILAELRNSLREMKFKTSSNQLKNIREIREAKKTVSRVLLLLTKKSKESKDESKEAGPKINLDKPAENEAVNNKK
jgi:ribosomal protein L29